MNNYQYEGSELDVFQHAQRWKQYVADELRTYLVGRVLEVGGGLGATAEWLFHADQSNWTSLEPDAALAAQMTERFARRPANPPTQVLQCTIADLSKEFQCDSVLYADVLEHIKDDSQEVLGATQRLGPGGFLVILAPAH